MVHAECECSEEVLAFLRAFVGRYAERDVDGLLGMVADDVVIADHRPLSTLSIVGVDAAAAVFRATAEVFSDGTVSVLVLEQHGDTYLARDTYVGHASAGGGAALVEWWVVDTLRDGRLAREDVYATEEEARAEYQRRTT